ncbi:hypothetical protein VTO42DRAFT_2553 [Malbranchea cinnamomea]
MTPFARSNAKTQPQRRLQDPRERSGNCAPPPSGQALVANSGEHVRDQNRGGGRPRDTKRVPKTVSLLSWMTQLFDFNSQESRRGTATTVPTSRLSKPKRLLSGLRKSTPNLRKVSDLHSFRPIPEVPQHHEIAHLGRTGEGGRFNDGFERFSPPLSVGTPLHISKTRRTSRSIIRIPRSVTSTVAKVDFNVGSRKLNTNGDLETWLAVNISAEVNNFEDALLVNNPDVALDVLIVVDNSEESTPEFIEAACRNAVYVASTLDVLTDRLGVGCVSSDPNRNLDLLLPLGPRDEQSILKTFNSLPALQLPQVQADATRLCDALREGAHWLLRQSNRGSLRHIFLLTPQSKIAIADDGYNTELLRLHTISPRVTVDILNSKAFYGWHVATVFSRDTDTEAINKFKDKMRQLVGYLRLGLDPGVLTNLSVLLKTSNGIEVKRCLSDTKYKRLRPGETWIMMFQVLTKEAPARPRDVGGSVEVDGQTDVDGILSELQGLLGSRDTEREAIITATVEYGQSTVPNDTTLRTTAKYDLDLLPLTGLFPFHGGVVNKVENVEIREDDSDEEGLYRVSKTGRKGYTGMAQGRNFSRRLGGRLSCDKHPSQPASEENRAWYDVHPAYQPPNPPKFGAMKHAISPERIQLGSMNPYRRLLAKHSEGNLHRNYYWETNFGYDLENSRHDGEREDGYDGCSAPGISPFQ